MAKAELTGISNLIALEVCGDAQCTCRDELLGEPEFARLSPHADGPNGSVLHIYPEGSGKQDNPVHVSGIPRPSEIKEAFDTCQGVIKIDGGEIVCGAIAKLRKHI